MKVLIWFLCLLVSSLITVFLSYAGVFLGGIPTVLLYVLAFWLARTFCKAWDNHKAQKQTFNTPAASIRVCKICNRNLPDGAEICQYCGTKIETDITVPSPIADNIETSITPQNATPANSIHDLNSLSPEDSLNKLLEIQVCETLSAAEENFHHQPYNENDPDFGLVPEKPVYTLALKSVAGEHEYLDKLYAATGEKITYTRLGSTSADGVNGITDIYNTYLPSGQLYKTIYINMYGANASTTAPAGFTIAPPHAHRQEQSQHLNQVQSKISTKRKKQYCSRCGNPVDTESGRCTGCGKQYFKRFRLSRFSTTVIVFVLIVIALLVVGIQQYTTAQSTINSLENRISTLENSVETYESLLTSKENTIAHLESRISDLEHEVSNLEEARKNLVLKLVFYNLHAAIVNTNSNYYHKYGCEYLDTSSFYIYNTEAAIQRGYKECPHCHYN